MPGSSPPAGQRPSASGPVAAPQEGHHPEQIRRIRSVQVDHPGSRPLSDAEQALLERFRERLRERVSSVGLTADDVRQLVKAMQNHPEASADVVRILREEASALMPGQSLFSFDWD